MSRVISRSDLLQGNKDIISVHIASLEANLEVRPLTSGQWAEIDAIKARGTKLSGRPVMGEDGNPDLGKTDLSLVIDLDASTTAEFEGDTRAVYYSVVGEPKWSLDDVRSISPANLVTEIAQEIYRISGVTRKQRQAIENFRP